jgi:hypothetical protein
MPVAPHRPPAADPAALPGSGARVVGHGAGTVGTRNTSTSTGTTAGASTSTASASGSGSGTVDEAREDQH